MPASGSGKTIERGYSIAAVSRLTGVSCHTLRVWERRYGFPTSARSPSGQRRYSPEIVDQLRRISDACHAGRPIRLVIDDLQTGRLDPPAHPPATPFDREVDHGVGGFLDAIEAGRSSAACDLLDEWEARFSSLDLISRFIHPAIVEVGERWYLGRYAIHHERLATSLLHRRLDALLDRARRGNPEPRGTVLLCALQGERHDGALRIVAPVLEIAGWRTESLGVDLPAEALARAVAEWEPHAVGISFVLSRNINKRFDELAAIRDAPILVGGRSLTNYQTLARRHGLLPLAADVSSMGEQWTSQVETWWSESGRTPPSRSK
ncbi:MAG: MerR family transcriptional regulator [Isosphaeraceae bacterium]|nr:MerR family transcriptional regulator [Isosphaeraceae bacterium]